MNNGHTSDTPENSKRKRSRATQACIICRKKKIKCDGTKPVCIHCRDSGIECEYTICKKRGPRKGYVQLLEERLVQLENRLSSMNESQMVYKPQGALFPSPSDHTISPTNYRGLTTEVSSHNTYKDNELPPMNIVIHLVDLFFKNINSVFPLIQRSILKESITDGTVSKPLLWSVIAVGARFSDHPSIKTDPPYWAAEKFAAKATSMINASLLEPTLSNLQYWGVMACLEYGSASGAKAWIYGCLSARICQELGLHKEETLRTPILNKSGSVDAVAMALRRRVFWSCLCIDKFSSAGTNRPQYFNKVDYDSNPPTVAESLLLRDPFHCLTFDNMEIVDDPLIDIPRYYLRLLGIFGEVNKFMARAKNDSASVSWPPINEFALLDKQLGNWKEGVPDRLQFTAANVRNYKKTASLNYISLWLYSHIMWCTSVMVLHRGCLAYSELCASDVPENVYHEIQSSINTCKLCVDTAIPVFQSMRDICGSIVLPYMGYTTYIFATALMTSTFSNDPESYRKSNHGLNTMFSLINGLKSYWPVCERLSSTVKDLLVTHNRLYDMQFRHNYQQGNHQQNQQIMHSENSYSKPSETRLTPQRTITTSPSDPIRPSLTSLLHSNAGYPYSTFNQNIISQPSQNYMATTAQQQPSNLSPDTLLNEVGGEINFNSSDFLYDSALFGQIMLDASKNASAPLSSQIGFEVPPMYDYNSTTPNHNNINPPTTAPTPTNTITNRMPLYG
ncbi:fungal-specific transcription factor domain-containing protein [Spinellus fusiger]|nr:fungal-specific transcription factor domain-containing protein [Spinellus fusiger]